MYKNTVGISITKKLVLSCAIQTVIGQSDQIIGYINKPHL